MTVPERATANSPGLHVFLRSWRKSRNMTLEMLAGQIGSKVSTISGWETGRRQMDLEDLNKLAAHYGVHPAALLFAPDEAELILARMQAASTIARRMDPEAASEWLALGKRLAPPDPSE